VDKKNVLMSANASRTGVHTISCISYRNNLSICELLPNEGMQPCHVLQVELSVLQELAGS